MVGSVFGINREYNGFLLGSSGPAFPPIEHSRTFEKLLLLVENINL